MTKSEMILGSQRLRELCESKALPEEVLGKLKSWWNSAIRNEESKVVSLDAWRERRKWRL